MITDGSYFVKEGVQEGQRSLHGRENGMAICLEFRGLICMSIVLE